MLKIVIAGKVVTPKVKRFCNYIINSLQQKSPYGIVCTVIYHLSELQQKSLMAQTV